MLQILMQFFIILSVIGLTWKIVRKESKFDREFASLTLVNFALCIAAIAVPYLSGSLETTRLYHLTLFFLAPFSVLGLVTIFRFLSKVRGHSAKSIVFTEGTALKVLSMILAVFLLFNTGFVYEIAGDHPYSISLSQNWINEHGNAQEKFALYSSINTPEEVFGAEWLSQYRNYTLGVYADYRARNNVLNAYAMISREEGKAIGAWEIKTVVIQSDSYVYLSGVNIFEHIMGGSSQLEATGSFSWFNDTQIVSAVTQEGDLIYSNGGTEIFYTPGLISLVLNGQ